ncbi:MAG: helix-hairpin-helix domain-containing protein, partial [Exilispira sp.]
RNLYQRKGEVLSSILSQGKLTKELEEKILNSEKLSEVEELYLPYKPKRKTRAAKAIEKGLAPLAEIIKKNDSIEQRAKEFINAELGVNNIDEAISGAMDIIAEEFAEFFDVRNLLRQIVIDTGNFEVKKKNPEEKDEFDMYKDYKEPVRSIKNHRILAINRGENKEKLSVKITIDDESSFMMIYKLFIEKNNCIDNNYLKFACDDGYKRLLYPSIISDIRQNLTEKAEKEAITVFAKNLYNLLLTPPLKNRRIMAIDPGIRTGSKIAILDEFGNYLDDTKIYQEEEEDSIDILEKLVKKYRVQLIAIGNGTACRDVEKLVAKAIKQRNLNCKFLIVPETGASVYSASDIAREEFPELDVTVRGAISIGRRVLDPLTEYVKIDPKSLGVGQYQHDVNQRELSKTLDEIVEDAVNKVGVFLNTASVPLLKHVSGISEKVAKNIVEYRIKHGPFKSRFDLLKVPGVGEKVFTQAAGFLRIPESSNKLDNSWIHPESYPIAEELLKIIESGKELKEEIALQIAQKYGKNKETIHDILEDFKRPARDPREDIEAPELKSDVLSIEDLQIGMILKGTVRNVTDFGAFVDIGIKNDGLVHISELSDGFVGDPLSVVQVGQIVEVRVIDIDKERGRVSLSMKKEGPKSPEAVLSKSSKSLNHNSSDHNCEARNLKNKQNQKSTTFGDLFKNIK